MNPATYSGVAEALARFGHDRVTRTQKAANKANDGISGANILALGCRETWLRNIEGGAQLINGVWVAETRVLFMDVGCFQISRKHHQAQLKKMPGVKVGTWKPVVEGKTAGHKGFAPRFADSLAYVLKSFAGNREYALDHGVKKADVPRVVIAAHNGGIGGAIAGYRAGDVDRYTTGGDYSEWVLATTKLINRWLGLHPNWKVAP